MMSMTKQFPKTHYCPDWDYMLISEIDPEYECCLCEKKPNPKLKPDAESASPSQLTPTKSRTIP